MAQSLQDANSDAASDENTNPKFVEENFSRLRELQTDPAIIQLVRTSTFPTSFAGVSDDVLRFELKQRGENPYGIDRDILTQRIIRGNKLKQAEDDDGENSDDSRESGGTVSSGRRNRGPPKLSPIDSNSTSRDRTESMEDLIVRIVSATTAAMKNTQQSVPNPTTVEVVSTPDVTDTIPVFSALTGQSPKDFVRAVDRASALSRWKPDLTVSIASTKLRGEAKSWHRTAGIAFDTDWAIYKEEFLKRFHKELTFQQFRLKLERRIQRDDETIGSYVQAKQLIYASTSYGRSLTLDDKVDDICKGLRNEATRTALWTTHATMEGFIQAANARQRHDESEEKHQATERNRQSDAVKFRSDKSLTKIDSGNERRHDNSSPKTFAQSSGETTSKIVVSKPIFEKKRSNDCYNCNKPGHMSRDCTAPKTERTIRAEQMRAARNITGDKSRVTPQVNCFLRSRRPDLPIVQATLNGIPVEACIDSGANISVILQSLVPSSVQQYPWIGDESIRVLDNSFKPKYAITAQVTLGNTRVELPNVVVSEHCPFDLLLGSDWRHIANVKVMLHPNNDVLVVPSSELQRVESSRTSKGDVFVVSSWQTEKSHRAQNDFVTLSAIADTRIEPTENELFQRIETVVQDVPDELTQEQRSRMRDILKTHSQAFVSGDDTLGLCPHAEHSIDLRDNIPVVCRPYRCSPADREFLREKVAQLKQMGVVRDSESEYASPTLVVYQPHHPSTPRRMVHDYRQLNKKTVNTPYPMPIIDDVIDEVTSQRAKFFNVMDIKTAFLTVRMRPEDVHKTAFVTPDGKYEYLRMAFGFCKAPQTMQAVMRKTFANLPNTATYMDDVGQGSPTVDGILDLLDEALRRVVINGLKMDLERCQFAGKEVKLLGYVITAEGRRPDPKRVADVNKFEPHRDAKRLYSFLQFANYFRKFIMNFSKITHPLRQLIRKETTFIWTEEHQRVVDELKDKLKNPPIIASFDPSAETIVRVDASQSGLGAVLLQIHDGVQRVIEYASKSLSQHDSDLHSNVLECMAIHWAVAEKFSIYLRGGRQFTVISDNYSVVYAASLGKLNRRYARWILDLAEYDFKVEHRSGNSNVVADALSRIVVTPGSLCLTLIQSTSERLRTLQEMDDMCCSQRRAAIENTDSKFVINQGILMHHGRHNKCNVEQIVIPTALRSSVLAMCHNEAGHMDFEKTLDRVKRRYWWPQMTPQVRAYVESCEICKRINQRTVRAMGILVPRVVQKIPNAVVSTDHIGPLPQEGTKAYILVFIDHATRYTDAVAVSGTSSHEFLDHLQNRWIYRFGVPMILVSDQGRGFVSRKSQELFHRFGIEHHTTAAYWPQANGLVERMVGTMKQCLRKFVLSQKSWSESLAEALFAINSSRQSSSRFSPFYLMHGYDPVLMGEPNLATILPELDEAERLRGLAANREIAATNLESAKRTQKTCYDAKRDPPRFEVGETVLYTVGQRSDTLAPYYEKPYVITEFLNENTVKIKRIIPVSGRQRVTTANIQQLRRFQPTPDWDCHVPDYLFGHDESSDPPADVGIEDKDVDEVDPSVIKQRDLDTDSPLSPATGLHHQTTNKELGTRPRRTVRVPDRFRDFEMGSSTIEIEPDMPQGLSHQRVRRVSNILDRQHKKNKKKKGRTEEATRVASRK